MPKSKRRVSWEILPDIVIEEIFLSLTIPQRYNCSQVCRRWYEAFFSPRLWRRLLLNGRSFTHRRLTPFKGYWREIDHTRLKCYLGAVGHYCRCITFAPISNYYNLGEFIKVIRYFLEFFDDFSMPCLEEFVFTFACETGWEDSYVTGTGGQILGELKRLLADLQGLSKLKISNLHLSVCDAYELLDNVVENCCDTLKELEMLNCTKNAFAPTAVTRFSALRTLVLSPQHLSRSLLLELVAQQPLALELLSIVQDRHTKLDCDDEADSAIDIGTWAQVKHHAPGLRVRLECRGITDNDLAMQEGAPVSAVVYDTPVFKVVPKSVIQITDYYRHSLKVYAHLGLPRIKRPKSFVDRADTLLVLLVRECPNLGTLVIRDRVSTATLLVIRSEAAMSLRTLVVRRKAVILRCDWPRSNEWTNEFYEHLRMTSRSYDDVEKELRKRFGTSWKMLSDREFKRTRLLT